MKEGGLGRRCKQRRGGEAKRKGRGGGGGGGGGGGRLALAAAERERENGSMGDPGSDRWIMSTVLHVLYVLRPPIALFGGNLP